MYVILFGGKPVIESKSSDSRSSSERCDDEKFVRDAYPILFSVCNFSLIYFFKKQTSISQLPQTF